MGIYSTVKSMMGSVFNKSAPFNYFPLNWRVPPAKKETDWLNVYSENVWVYSAVSKIAQSISMVDWSLVTENSDGEQIELTNIKANDMYKLLSRPNPFMTWQEFIELHMIFMELTGESYWIISKNGLGEPAELWPVPPDRMWVVPDKDNFVKGYVYIFGGENIPFEPDEVIHHTYPNPLNVYKGVGPAQATGYVIDIDNFGQQFSKNFFYNGATPGGIIECPSNLAPEEYNRLKEQWNISHAGVDKAHRVGILEGGATYKQVEINLREIQLIENRKQNREDILAGFGVPNSVLGISDNVNKANAEVGEYTFAKRTLKPRLIKLSEKINCELLPMFKSYKRMAVEFVFDEVTPDDEEMLLKKATSGVGSGIMTINEGREMLGLDTLSNGDVFLIPSSVQVVNAKDLQILGDNTANPPIPPQLVPQEDTGKDPKKPDKTPPKDDAIEGEELDDKEKSLKKEVFFYP